MFKIELLMRITTLVKNYFIYFVLLASFFGFNNSVYSQCPTVTNATQSFCDTQSPKIASLVATNNGGGIKWYATATSTTPLTNTTSLINGEDYFADDNSGSCGVRQSVVVTIYFAPTGANFQGVCVANLSQATLSNPQFVINGNNLKWYTTPTGGVPISNSTILTDNTIYYISQTNPDTGCETFRLQLFVNIVIVTVPTGSAVQEFCNNNPPTVNDLVASGNNNWYLTPNFGIHLDLTTLLVNGQHYYGSTIDPPCESSDRLDVLVNIYEPNDAGSDGNLGICINQVASTSPFDLYSLLGGTPDNTGIWTGPIATTNGYQGTLNVSTMNLDGSPYVFTYTVSSALCSTDTSNVTITILPQPTATIAVSPTNICLGSNATVTFTGTPNAVVTYTINSGANQTITLNASGTATLNDTYGVTTTITLVSIATTGLPSCDTTLSESVTITVVDPIATIAANPTTVCSGSNVTVTFTGTPNAIVTYTINNGANQTITLNASGTATLNTTYGVNTTISLVSVSASGQPSCTKSLTETITITVIDPIATVAVSPTTVCLGTNSTVTFTGTPNAVVTFTINNGANQAITLNDSGTATLSDTYSVNTTITLISVATSGNPSCTKQLTQSVTITLIDPTATVTVNPANVCLGSNVTVTFTGTPNAEVVYTINSGANQTITLNASGTASLSTTYVVNTTITLVSVTTSGTPSCTKALTQSITITVIDPTASVSVNTTTVCSTTPLTITFTGTPNATVTYTINGGSNQIIVLDGSGSAVLSNTYTVDTTIVLVSVTTSGTPSCSKQLTQSLTITVIDPIASIAVNPMIICTGNTATITFTGTPNATVTYTINGGSNQTIVLDGSGSGVLSNMYTVDTVIALVSVTTSGTPSCTKPLTQTITITVIDPTASISVNPTTVCSVTPSTITFTGTPNATVTYTINGGSNQTIVLDGSGSAVLSNTYAVDTTIVLVSVTTAGTPSCTKLLNQSITLTVIQAPNSGGIGQTLTVCANLTSLDLFTGLNGTQETGTWNDDDSSGALSNNIFNPSAVGAGTYHFTYTVLGTFPCENATSTVTVIVVTMPNAGIAITISPVCPSTGIIDLTSLLSGEDAIGIWTDTGSQVVTSPINIINFTAGTYSYTYTVTNACGSDIEMVQFTVLANPQLSTVNIAVLPLCVGTNAIVNLNGMVNGTYTLNYDLNGSNVLANQSVVVTITAGVGNFTIPTASIPNAGTTVITFTSIVNNTTTCSKTLTNVAIQIIIKPLADIDNSNLSIANVCLGNNVVINIANATNLPDGVYQFNYSIPGATPPSGNSGNITITSGTGQFTIPLGSFTTAGNYILTITGIITATGCTNGNENATANFTVNPILNPIGATISAQAACPNVGSLVTISGASNLADGAYSITYQLTGVNSSTTTILVNFASGVATFTIPGSDLVNAGDTTITINQLISTVTTCGISGTIFASATFSVNTIAPPVLTTEGERFCSIVNPTIADLSANIVGAPTLIWYNAPISGTPYNVTDLLIDGTTYYAVVVSQSGCESERLAVTVIFCNEIIIPDGFSPNNDGVNDTFEIPNLAILYPNFKLEIYNRYGNLIFTGNRNMPNWSGTTTENGLNLNNNLLPTGVYFYILNFNNGIKNPMQGRVYLNR